MFGVPATSVDIRVRRQHHAEWHQVIFGSIEDDGQLILSDQEAHTGTYQLEIDIDGYYATLGIVAAYSRVIIEFGVAGPASEIHLTMFISPSSFHSYRVASSPAS